jgi:hypothetical protein
MGVFQGVFMRANAANFKSKVGSQCAANSNEVVQFVPEAQ